MKKIVTIGGGTGTFTLLSGLKKLDVDITAIVNVTDNGGSTGKLRDSFGYLPVGDFRMALCALSDANGDSHVLRELFQYRFSRGKELEGHNFGNLFLTALTDLLGNEEKAFSFASKILRIKGKVLPISLDNVSLVAEYDNGEVIFGEKHIDEPNITHNGKLRIKKLFLQPKAKVFSESKKAILESDLIILGPGDLYTSTIANLVVTGVKQAILKSRAKIVFVINMMTKFGQTYGFKSSDFVNEIKKYTGKYPEFVFVNKSDYPQEELEIYESINDFPVINDLKKNSDFKVVVKNFCSAEKIYQNSADRVQRSFIRHDSDILAQEISKLL